MMPFLLAFFVNDKPPVRDLRPGLERKYRVSVVQGEDDRSGYRLRLRVTETKAPKGGREELRLDVRLTDYRATSGGHAVSMRSMGGGEMTVEPTGLPGGLNVSGPQGPIWLPLVAFYLPGMEGEFEVAKVDLGGGLSMAGKGKFGEKSGFEVAASLSRDGKELGKLTFGATLDKQGWPTKAEGTLVSADGTTRFTLEKA